MENGNEISKQVILIEEAMRRAGIWNEGLPEWVQSYTGTGVRDVWSWLQFVHLPQRTRGLVTRPQHLAPQLRQYLDPGIREHRELIQRLIELDSLTPGGLHC